MAGKCCRTVHAFGQLGALVRRTHFSFRSPSTLAFQPTIVNMFHGNLVKEVVAHVYWQMGSWQFKASRCT